MSARKVLKRLFLTGEGRGYVEGDDDIVDVALYVTADGTVKARKSDGQDVGIDQDSARDDLAVRISRGTLDQT